MIYLLFFLTCLLLFIIFFFNNKNFLSCAFFATGSFVISEFFYIIGYRVFSTDLKQETIAIILSTLIVYSVGETIGSKLKITIGRFDKSETYTGKYIYKFDSVYIYSLFIIMLFIFGYRFYDLYLYSLKVGNNGGVFGTIAASRLGYAMGEYEPTLPLYQAFIYGTLICEILASFLIYAFVNNLIVAKRIDRKLLLPVLGYCIILVALTDRTQYIKLLVFTFISIIAVTYRTYRFKNKTSFNGKLVRRILFIGVTFIVFFFVYGTVTRNLTQDFNLSETLAAYISAPLYGLNWYLQHPWEKNPYFGYYTLTSFYSIANIFGANYNLPKFHLRMFEYGHLLTSNIWTWLVLPIQDYGIPFTIFSRLPLGFLNGVYQRKLINTDMRKPAGITTYIFSGILFYCAIMAFCADRYKEILLNPQTLFKYTLFAWIVIRFIAQYRIEDYGDQG